MPRHDERIDLKIKGPAWDDVRDKLLHVHDLLLHVNNDVSSELTTIYIKYKVYDTPLSSVYAVLWIKTPKNIVLGLATEVTISNNSISSAPKGMSYKGLNSYINISKCESLPEALNDWINAAFSFTCSHSS